MSILINLLPDTRQAKLRERHRRQLVSGVSILVWAICGGTIAVLSLYAGGQKVVINNYKNNIAEKKVKLQNIAGLTDAMTAQQHLASLPDLYSKRVYLTKFFNAYAEANPNEITIASMSVDAQNALAVNGSGNSYAVVAKLARALEASNVKVGTGANETNEPYFTNVTLLSAGQNNKVVGFTLNATLAPGVTNVEK